MMKYGLKIRPQCGLSGCNKVKLAGQEKTFKKNLFFQNSPSWISFFGSLKNLAGCKIPVKGKLVETISKERKRKGDPPMGLLV